jgi:signal transduction histidine kinase
MTASDTFGEWAAVSEDRGRWAARHHWPLAAEIALFGALLATDEVMGGRLGLHRPGGGLSTAVAVTIVALVVLRRRLPDRLPVLGGCAIGLSLAHSGLAVLSRYDLVPMQVGFSVTELVAVALMVGTVARRIGGWAAVVLGALGGVALTAAPLARTGTGVDVKVLGVPGALLWGVAVAFGLILRDADVRLVATSAEVRRAERMRIARELHDLVTHHVTGIAVRAQAAQMVATKTASAIDHDQTYTEIQEAAAASLTAMRRLVGMLRTEQPPVPASTGIHAALDEAVATDPRVTIGISPAAHAVDPGPDVSATLHWIALEALTNIRRHAAGATQIGVTVSVDPGRRIDTLVLEIVNDGVADTAITGEASARYGLTGMRERVTALSGTLHAGPDADRCWRITARVPLERRPKARASSNEAYS